MRVLIAGATGLVGRELLKILIDDADIFEIHVLTRRPLDIQAVKIRSHLAELGELWLHSLSGLQFDAIYCCLGTTMKLARSEEAFRKVDFDAVVRLALFAQRSNAGFFGMVSSVGADSESSNFYLKTKGQAEDAVLTLGLSRVAIANPSILLGQREESRPGEKLVIWWLSKIDFIFRGWLEKYRPIQAHDVARQLWISSKQIKK